MPTAIILGIDPGTRRTGFGFVAVEAGTLRYLDSGIVAPPMSAPLPDRLLLIFKKLVELIERRRPTAVAVEDIFFSRHPQGALKLGHARGVALLAAAQAGVAIHSYPPAQVKRALSGHGRAEKAQIARLVSMLLAHREPLQEDEADALSLAICHAAAAGLLGARTP